SHLFGPVAGQQLAWPVASPHPQLNLCAYSWQQPTSIAQQSVGAGIGLTPISENDQGCHGQMSDTPGTNVDVELEADSKPALPLMPKPKATPKTLRYRCTHCDKVFSRPSARDTHIYSHTGEKPHMCEYPGCGKSFSVSSNKTRHEKTHLDDRKDRLRHQRNAHGSTNETRASQAGRYQPYSVLVTYHPSHGYFVGRALDHLTPAPQIGSSGSGMAQVPGFVPRNMILVQHPGQHLSPTGEPISAPSTLLPMISQDSVAHTQPTLAYETQTTNDQAPVISAPNGVHVQACNVEQHLSPVGIVQHTDAPSLGMFVQSQQQQQYMHLHPDWRNGWSRRHSLPTAPLSHASESGILGGILDERFENQATPKVAEISASQDSQPEFGTVISGATDTGTNMSLFTPMTSSTLPPTPTSFPLMGSPHVRPVDPVYPWNPQQQQLRTVTYMPSSLFGSSFDAKQKEAMLDEMLGEMNSLLKK
ncbi:hypothetical protein FBU31_003845, partial [Coemansia sp. 'formosensis']